tara:strand:- start:661 stop:4560 length:3900 start_codon:yes stop_codon:yes gene_type:complete
MKQKNNLNIKVPQSGNAMILGLAKAIDIYIEAKKNDPTLQELIINNHNIIDFINQNKLLVNPKIYQDFLPHREYPLNLSIDINKSMDENIINIYPSIHQEDNDRSDTDGANKIMSQFQHSYISENIQKVRDIDSDEDTLQNIQYHAKSLVEYIYLYVKNSLTPDKLNFNIRDIEGYTPLGVACLWSYDGTGVLYGSPKSQDAKCFLKILDLYKIKISPELRIEENKTYINIVDFLLNHVISPTNEVIFNQHSKLDKNESNKLMDEVEYFYQNPIKIFNVIETIYVHYVNMLNQYIDLSALDNKDLAVACFKNKTIFKTLVGVFIPKEHDVMEFSEIIESTTCRYGDHNFSSASLLSWCSIDSLKNIYLLLVKNKLKYDIDKLNIDTGEYAFIGDLGDRVSVQEEKRLQNISDIAQLNSKKIDLNHEDDWGCKLFVKDASYFMAAYHLAQKQGQNLDISGNNAGLFYNKNNFIFCEKMANVQSHYFSPLKYNDLGFRSRALTSPLEEESELKYQIFKLALDKKIVLSISAEHMERSLISTIENGEEDDLSPLLKFVKQNNININLNNIFHSEGIFTGQTSTLLTLLDYINENDISIAVHNIFVTKEKNDVSYQDESISEQYKKGLILLYQSVFNKFKILSDLKTICDNIKCTPCKELRNTHKEELNEKLINIISKEDLDINQILSDLTIRYIKTGLQLKNFVTYAEKNGVDVNLYTFFDKKTLIEKAALIKDDLALKVVLSYAERHDQKIDLTYINECDDTILYTILAKKDKLAIIFDRMLQNPDLFIYNEKDKYIILKVLNRHTEALEYCNNKENNIDAEYFKAQIFHEQDKLEDSKKVYDTIIIRDSKFANAHYGKALVLYDQKKYDEALEYLDNAMARDTNNLIYDLNKAKILLEIGDREEAMAVVDDMNAKDPMAIDRLFNPMQKKLFIKITQIVEECAQEKNNIAAQQQQGLVLKVVHAFNTNAINSSQVQLLQNEIERVKHVILDQVHQKLEIIENKLDTKLSLNQVEVHVLKVDQEILNNVVLKSYYDALHDKLYSAMLESEVITNGNMKLNDNIGAYAGGFCFALTLIPLIGTHVSSATKGALQLHKENEIKSSAIYFKNSFGINPDERKTQVKKLSEQITLDNQKNILSANVSQELQNWNKCGLLSKIQNFLKVNTNNELYISDEEKLGCIDALKIIACISCGHVNDKTTNDTFNYLVNIPNSFTCTPTKTVSQIKKLSCCQIFVVKEFIFDNELLNHPIIFNKLASIFGINKVLDLSTNISPEIIQIAMEEDNIDLLSGAIMSLDSSDLV